MQYVPVHIRHLLTTLLLVFLSLTARAQFLDCTTGFFMAPTADMNPSGTFMITNTFLDRHATNDNYWQYDTFGYGFDITLWSRVEIAYVMVLVNGSQMPGPISAWHRALRNQDRHFSAKLQLLKEGEFGLKWVPAIAVGVVDPTTGGTEDYISGDVSSGGNGYFNRYYAMLTKHQQTPIGEFGLHIGYQYSQRIDFPINDFCVGVNWRPKWIQDNQAKLNIFGEYDARTWNTGLVLSFYEDHFDLMVGLQNVQWLSWAVRYKIVLF